jgi:hypothetical protein
VNHTSLPILRNFHDGVERSTANPIARDIMHLDGLRTIPEEELRMLIRPSGCPLADFR